MAELNFQDAVQVLRDNLGMRVDTTETDGRDDMLDVLKGKLGYSSAQANEMIDALIESGTVRYRRGESADAATSGDGDVEVVPVAVPAAAGGLGMTGSNTMGAAVIPGALSAGYWQIGTDDETEIGGRAGQIDPTL